MTATVWVSPVMEGLWRWGVLPLASWTGCVQIYVGHQIESVSKAVLAQCIVMKPVIVSSRHDFPHEAHKPALSGL